MQTRFGTLLSSLRAERGFDVLGLRALCRGSDEASLRGICRSSIDDYELGHVLPFPSRAEALARLLECPRLLEVYQEERKPSRTYWWKAKAGLIPDMIHKPLPESRRNAISRTKKGRPGKPRSEAERQAISKALKGRPKSEAHRQAMSRAFKGRSSPEATQASIRARTIQDEFTDLENSAWRFQQRRKRDTQTVSREKRPRWTTRVIQDEFMGLGNCGWRYDQRQKRARLAASKAAWVPPEGWEPYSDNWGEE